MGQRKKLNWIMCHPGEPVNSHVNLPNKYISERYKHYRKNEQSQYANEQKDLVIIKDAELPDCEFAADITIDEIFSPYIPKHRKIAGKLITILMKCGSCDEFFSVCAYIRDRINPYLFNYAVCVALIHRPDTNSYERPSFFQCFPDKFIDSEIFIKLIEEITVKVEEAQTPILPLNYTGSFSYVEQWLSYYREDIGLNLFYYDWHLNHPFEGCDASISNKDRRGELFAYLCSQILARYNCERISNHLPCVIKISCFNDPIAESYFPKLDTQVGSRSWSPRCADTKIQDLCREQDSLKCDIYTLQRWWDRIVDSVDQKCLINDNGNRISLNDEKGIDYLANVIFPINGSPNRSYYGDFYNMGHAFISFSHDPDGRHLECCGVMGDVATALRDPAYYRWLALIVEIFQRHKSLLPHYTKHELDYSSVTMTSCEVLTQTKDQGNLKNCINTYLAQSDVDVSKGLNFINRNSAFVRVSHLQHEDCVFKIKATNSSSVKCLGTVRIFMAPVKDDKGRSYDFDMQRKLMIELDKFVVSLNPGANVIMRQSKDSSLTIPYEKTYNYEVYCTKANLKPDRKYNPCICGWPQNLLFPKGTESGMKFDLFVMITNFHEDKVNVSNDSACGDSSSYCGYINKKYSDRRPMGFPFDRCAQDEVKCLKDFLTPNMACNEITIKFNENHNVKPIET